MVEAHGRTYLGGMAGSLLVTTRPAAAAAAPGPAPAPAIVGVGLSLLICNHLPLPSLNLSTIIRVLRKGAKAN
jgi:hypothetical protein